MSNEKNCQDCVYFEFAPIFLCKFKGEPVTIDGKKCVIYEYCIDERTTGDCGKEGKNFIPKSEPKDEWD